jgi:sugar phosphate permease
MTASIFTLTFLCVAARHSLMAAWFNCAGEVHSRLSLSSSALGMINMFFLLSYAVGNFVLGVLGDSYRQKRVLCYTASAAAVLHLLVLPTQLVTLSYFHLLTSGLMGVIFALIGFCQSSIWPMTVAIMGQAYPHAVRGKIVGLWSVNSAAGDIVGYLFSSLLLSVQASWAVVTLLALFLYAAVVALCWAFLPDHENEKMKPRIALGDALRLPTVFNYCACYACVKLLHMAILIWIPYYLEVVLRVNMNVEGILMILYSVGGVVGGIFSGYISDKVEDRSYVMLAMLVASVPMINLMNFEFGRSNGMSFVIIFVIGALISGGSNLLSGVIAADMCDLDGETEAKSTLTGLVDCSGGLGASLGQILVGGI